MLNGQLVLAVVPARSGSLGVADKNMRLLKGRSLIAWAGATVRACDFIDAAVLSTDSERYAEEGRAVGLDVPFMRSASLATSSAAAMDVLRDAVRQAEGHYGRTFGLILLVEPTSPLRTADDLRRTAEAVLVNSADAAVTVSRLDAHYHPWKVLRLGDDMRLDHFAPEGRSIRNRQELPQGLVIRNGACYAATRACVFEHDSFFTTSTVGCVIERPLVNIDSLFDLKLAELLMELDQ